MRSVNLGRWSRYVERYFNIKGGGGLYDVEQTLRLGLLFQSGAEDRYLQGWNRFAVVASQTAVAAQFARTRIRNPVGSNVIAVLEQICYFSTTATADTPFVTYGAATTDLTTLIGLTFTRMDPRGSPQPTSIVSTNQQAAGGQALLQRGITGANVNVDYINSTDQQIPILPGQVVDVQANTANTASTVTFIWRERALEASELT